MHSFADRLERGEGAVTFVEVEHARRNSQRPQRLDAADAEHQLLANPRAMVAAVQAARQLAILRPAFFDVAVEQIQANAADLHQPDLGEQRSRCACRSGS